MKNLSPLDKACRVFVPSCLIGGLLIRFFPGYGTVVAGTMGIIALFISLWCFFSIQSKGPPLIIAALLCLSFPASAQVSDPKEMPNLCKVGLRASGIGAALYMVYELWRFCEENIPNPDLTGLTNNIPAPTNSVPVSTNKPAPPKKTAALYIATSNPTVFLQCSVDQGRSWFDIHSRTRSGDAIVTTNLLTGFVSVKQPQRITNNAFTTFLLDDATMLAGPPEQAMFRLTTK